MTNKKHVLWGGRAKLEKLLKSTTAPIIELIPLNGFRVYINRDHGMIWCDDVWIYIRKRVNQDYLMPVSEMVAFSQLGNVQTYSHKESKITDYQLKRDFAIYYIESRVDACSGNADEMVEFMDIQAVFDKFYEREKEVFKAWLEYLEGEEQ